MHAEIDADVPLSVDKVFEHVSQGGYILKIFTNGDAYIWKQMGTPPILSWRQEKQPPERFVCIMIDHKDEPGAILYLSRSQFIEEIERYRYGRYIDASDIEINFML